MHIKVIRSSFILFSAFGCYLLTKDIIIGIVGLGAAFVLVVGEILLHQSKARRYVASVFGLIFGLLISWAGWHLLNPSDLPPTQDVGWLFKILNIVVVLGFGYIGMVCGYYISESLPVVRLFSSYRYTQMGTQFATDDSNGFKLLDTSVIIDGRILEICETQFIDGTLLIPRFVLNELQHIADSTELLRRNKGRRGFDILRSLQNSPSIAVEIIEEDVPHLDEVDAKLVHLARKHFAKIITNDLNLNKVAELQGITVLNINELANAIRPIVVAGEIIQVHLQKIGKEPNQGVGYLDDGTMVIVEDGKQYIGHTLDVVVTQMLRTSTGQMIFARNVDDASSVKGY
ncbi:MAG: twitching motility protein PilT [Candidatus Poribacteria bacterium]|nr:twitching motility protein PilT [Candidatus Poribacteria bacterium]